jgi:hypothetical protein
MQRESGQPNKKNSFLIFIKNMVINGNKYRKDLVEHLKLFEINSGIYKNAQKEGQH